MSRFTFFLDNLDVVRFRASQDEQIEPHVSWSVGYAPVAVEFEDGLWVRIVIGTLHARGDTGWAEVDAGAFFISQEDVPDEDLEARLRESSALEGLYDFARTHLRGFLATINAAVELPMASPDAELFVLEPRDDLPVDAAEEAETDNDGAVSSGD